MMIANNYKFTNINGSSIAYTDKGQGQPIFLIHGFGSFSLTWNKISRYFLPNFRVITVDLKGFGYSEKTADNNLSVSDQSLIVSGLIKFLDLSNVVLVGHSFGGSISLCTLFDEDIKKKVSHLVLIDSFGLSQNYPGFISVLSNTSPKSPLLKIVREELIVEQVMQEAYFDHGKIDRQVLKEYGDVLRMDHAKECLVAAARQVAINDFDVFREKVKGIKLPALILWGNDDRLVDVKDAYDFKSYLNAELKILHHCGHLPHEEMTPDTAKYICDFLNSSIDSGVVEGTDAIIDEPADKKEDRKMKREPYSANAFKMSSLIDRWSIGTVMVFLFVKMLQLLKKIGLTSEENGWRKATSIFLRTEHSRFMLASFRLNYCSGRNIPREKYIAKQILLERLTDFLRKTPACHWTFEWSYLRSVRKQVYFTDIMEVEFSRNGKLIKLVPHFDKSRSTFTRLKKEIIEKAINKLIKIYNKNINLKNDAKRPRIIHKKLHRWANYKYGLTHSGRQELKHLIDRILSSTFIQFQMLPEKTTDFIKLRLATPNMYRAKHPGFGLLNIVCRFTHNYDEADLWFQYHHIPVDGMPMQEMLLDLKKEWGAVGPVVYPALKGNAAKTELFYCGHNVYRARIYINFEKFIAVRKYLNNNYSVEMEGPATFLSMMAWGVAQSDFFKDCKFLIPFNISHSMSYTTNERSLSLIFIRPDNFFDDGNKLAGFLAYQREFNRCLAATKSGKSESHELLELYSLAHPLFFYCARYLMPKTMGSVVGTAGLTMLKDAEMFVSPLTDIQQKGFVAFGNLMLPTEDGETAGAVSICASKKQMKEYIKIIKDFSMNYDKMLNLEL